MTMVMRSAALAACVLVSGCGGDGGNATATSSTAAPAGAAAPAGGDALVGGWADADACATLDKSVVAAVAGQAVTKADLTKSIKAGADPVSRSQCNYLLADGRTVMLSTRIELPVDNDKGMATFADQEKSMNMTPEEVPGIGKGAYWTPGDMPHLDFWIGQHQVASIQFKGDASTIMLKKEDEPWAKDLAIKLSHKIGG
jgi:hypothetical protein